MNELTINLNSRSKKPLYEQIYDHIKSDIQNGRLRYGEKLPSTRALSKHLEVSRSTVELAYEQLLSEGYIESAPYRGFFVAQIDELYQLKKEEKKPEGIVLMAKLNKHAVIELVKIINYTVDVTANYMKMEARCQKIYSMEERGDDTYRETLSDLFYKNNDVMYALRWKEILVDWCLWS